MLQCSFQGKKLDFIPADHQKLSEQGLRLQISRCSYPYTPQLIALVKQWFLIQV